MPEIVDSLEDAELARLARDGDRQAYGMLVDRHLSSVFCVIRRIVFNATDAEDLTQDTFVRALTKLDQYGRDYPFRNWLLKIASNLAINHIRSRQRERLRLPRIAEGQSREPEELEDVPNMSEWESWLARLEPAQRTALVLFHFQEMPYAEIAQVMEVPVNTVRTHLHRGRHRLKELMTAKTPQGVNRPAMPLSPGLQSREVAGPEKSKWTVVI